MFLSGTKKIKEGLLYPTAKKYLKTKEIWKPKTICIFFVKDEVLVKFRLQNLEGIKIHGTFIELKRKKRKKTFRGKPIGNQIILSIWIYKHPFKKMHWRKGAY